MDKLEKKIGNKLEQEDRVKASGKFEDYHPELFPRVFKNTITSFLLVTNEFTSNDILSIYVNWQLKT